jgi:predicted nucleotidyltransferase
MEDAALSGVSAPGAASHAGFDDCDLATLHAIFAEVVQALDRREVPYVVIGGLASAALGRPRASGDIDILVTPHDARPALTALSDAGFHTDDINPHWLFKAIKHGVLVDLLFKMKGDIYLDDEMLTRADVRNVYEHPARVIPREDLVVVKALAHDEESRGIGSTRSASSRAGARLGYLVRRAAGPRRVLSLLLYATSVDLVVPPSVIRRLHDVAFIEPDGDDMSAIPPTDPYLAERIRTAIAQTLA